MKWGSFGPVHIATLILGAAMMMGLYYLLKNRSKRVQTTVLGVLSLYCVAAVTFDFLRWGSPLEYLPLHLCSFNALLLPVAIFSRNKALCNMLLLWSLGAGAALLINTAQAEYVLLSDVFCFYFFSHVLEFGIPILLFKLGLAEKDPKCIVSTMLISIGIYTAVHFINLSINAYCAANQILNSAGEVIKVNYMFSMWSDNALLDVFYRILPLPYWYMYLVFPIVVLYLAAVYAPQIVSFARKKRNRAAV